MGRTQEQDDKVVGNAVNSDKRVLALLKELFYDRPSYVKGDSHATAFKEGQRDVVGFLIQCVELTKKGGDDGR